MANDIHSRLIDYCKCGSGQIPWPWRDEQGNIMGYVCTACVEKKMNIPVASDHADIRYADTRIRPRALWERT